MSKEQYYNKIKRYIYRKFDELEVINKGAYVYLRYKNDDYADILFRKELGYVYYYSGFKKKIINITRLETRDFEILLYRWIENTLQIKVNEIYSKGGETFDRFEIPFK